MKYYHVYANKMNVGDLLSAVAIKNLSKYDYHDMLWTKGHYKRTTRLLDYLKPEDRIIIGGGGLLKDTFLPLWDLIIKNYQGNKIVLWGIGECINKTVKFTGLPDNIIASIANIASNIYVRDIDTRDRFTEIGTNVEVIGCPSTTIASSWLNRGGKYLLHVVHPDLLKGSIDFWRKNVRKLALDLNLQYMEFDHIIPSFFSKSQKLLITRRYYENAGMVVSSRLHGIILGSAQGIPVIPISNDFKIESYWRGTLGGEKVLGVYDYGLLRDFVLDREYDPPELIFNNVEKIVDLNRQTSFEIEKTLDHTPEK